MINVQKLWNKIELIVLKLLLHMFQVLKFVCHTPLPSCFNPSLVKSELKNRNYRFLTL
jgi:hypothetical protein